jgi:hypothetical protein
MINLSPQINHQITAKVHVLVVEAITSENFALLNETTITTTTITTTTTTTTTVTTIIATTKKTVTIIEKQDLLIQCYKIKLMTTKKTMISITPICTLIITPNSPPIVHESI